MKKVIILLIILFFIFANTAYASAKTEFEFDTSNVSKGVLALTHPQFDQKYKLLIQKDGTKYYFDIVPNKQIEYFPLVMGDGTYTIKIYKNLYKNQYSFVSSENIDVVLLDQNQPFLQSIQSVEWNYSMSAIQEAYLLTQDLSSEQEKVDAIYNYVIQNIEYDYTKTADSVSSTYLPDIEDTYSTGLGMCYDFSSLFACMLRSAGIPAKLVKGYTNNFNGYHSWNEVYINGEWQIIDTTYDSIRIHCNRNYSMFKDSADYTVKFEY